MSQASLFISPYVQMFDDDGDPLDGGTIEFYEPGTTTPKAVYADGNMITSLGTVVTLDSAGRAKIWLSGYYYVIVKDSLGNTVGDPQDNVSTAYSPAAASAITMSEWQDQTDTPTYIGVTQFSVVGDKTLVYTIGRRIKAVVTAGTIYGTITNVAAAGAPIVTTVTVLWDLSYALDGGLSSVSTGIISPIASGSPYQVPIGVVLDWYPALAGVPVLSYGFVQCDGQTLTDPASPMNGQVIPNLNGAAAGADTFSNSKTAVYTRGGTVSGTYSADTVKAHTHGTSAITAATHSHGPGTFSTDSHTGHTHQVSIYKQFANAQSGSGSSNLWQDSPDGSNKVTSDSGGAHSHTVTAGTSDASGALALTGSTDNNGAATETIPKTVTVIKIMRVK